MNKVIFGALIASWVLAVTGWAPALAASHEGVRESKGVTRVVLLPSTTWTCARNGYRSVACP